jgi:hypothetical protein
MSARGPRYDAKIKGEKHYMAINPCKRGHIALRITATGTCVECRKITAHARYHSDPIKTKEIIKSKYQANPEKYRELRRQAYALNPEKEREVAKIRSVEWRKLNPNHEGAKTAKRKYANSPRGKIKAYVNLAKRRAAKLQRTPSWLTPIDFERIENEYKLAAILTKLWGEAWHVDHIIPLQGKMVSGLHVPSNLQVLRGKDNVKKANGYLPA